MVDGISVPVVFQPVTRVTEDGVGHVNELHGSSCMRGRGEIRVVLVG